MKKLTLEKEKRESFVRKSSITSMDNVPRDLYATGGPGGGGGGVAANGEPNGGDGIRASFRDNLEDVSFSSNAAPVRISKKRTKAEDSSPRSTTPVNTTSTATAGGGGGSASTPAALVPSEDAVINPMTMRKNPASFDMSDSESRTHSVADDGGV